MTQQIVAAAIDQHAQVSQIVNEQLELRDGELGDDGHFIDVYDGELVNLRRGLHADAAPAPLATAP